LVRRANAGSEECLAGLRAVLDDDPQLWRRAGDVGARAERAWVELLAAGNQLAAESIPRRLRELKAELAGPRPSPLEELLVQLLGLSWLAVCHAEAAAAEPGGSLPQAALRYRRAESAGRRFVNAAKLLATLRELAPRGLLPRAAGRGPQEAGAGDAQDAGNGCRTVATRGSQ
jgi:hypothetical protein